MKKSKLQLDVERFINNEDLINCTYEMVLELIYMEFESKNNRKLEDVLELEVVEELIESKMSSY